MQRRKRVSSLRRKKIEPESKIIDDEKVIQCAKSVGTCTQNKLFDPPKTK